MATSQRTGISHSLLASFLPPPQHDTRVRAGMQLEMNELLRERFRRACDLRPTSSDGDVGDVEEVPRLNWGVRAYFDDHHHQHEGEGAWLQRQEFPTSDELLDLPESDPEGSMSSEPVELNVNRPTQAWDSKEEYLRTHYELLREDSLQQLRVAIQGVRTRPTAGEDAFIGVGIYAKVHICAITCSPRGIATKVTFSLARVGKKILWEQSKRLRVGSLVALTPSTDMFQTKAIAATVAARPLEGLAKNPPEIDLFFVRAEEQEIDPSQEFLMIEVTGSLYEANRPTLLALQRMMHEPFPLSEHLVSAHGDIAPPSYLNQRPHVDMTQVFPNLTSDGGGIDILKAWPEISHESLDASQIAALRCILTKRLAMVQGPPGTGKTYVSVEAIKIILANRQDGDPPIVVACQTNHAVDQLLRHIVKFEPDFVRLGGQSKDKDVIKPRTLYEMRQARREQPPPGCLLRSANADSNKAASELKSIMKPLSDKGGLDPDVLCAAGILTELQANDLKQNSQRWSRDDRRPSEVANINSGVFGVWLGKALVKVPERQVPENFGFEYEEVDLEFEQLKEIEAESSGNDEEPDTLHGEVIEIADCFKAKVSVRKTEIELHKIMQEQTMSKIPSTTRPAVYQFLQAEQKRVILAKVRAIAHRYNRSAGRRRIGGWEKDENILKKQKILGMTTSGLSRYRGLLAALGAQIVLIEEAGETLEAPVAAACFPSVKHLILVGDHQQLRPHCNVRELEDHPFFLNISLFERLINNGLPYVTLREQRRMIPEVRRMLFPIYQGQITDHPSVRDSSNRPNVPGMGGVNSFFFTHENPEKRDSYMSTYNPHEADMIVGFVEYLVYNGMDCDDITVLTFYNGQRKRILKGLRERPSLSKRRFTVVTVDSYQGEENKVVILSLVRNNDKGQIGFLDIDNRICVSLSRAQCGFYIFGSVGLLGKTSKTWRKVIQIMINKGKHQADHLVEQPKIRMGLELPVRCQNHGNQTLITGPADWTSLVGGCAKEKCGGTLACGHPCDLMCHPFPHGSVVCPRPCTKVLSCGHKCRKHCGENCECKCGVDPSDTTDRRGLKPASSDNKPDVKVELPSSVAWRSFSHAESDRYKAEALAAQAMRLHSADQPMTSQYDLVDVTVSEVTDDKLGMLRIETTAVKDWSKETSLLD